jgi:uncharacterized protein (TIGR02996 family)
VGLREVQVAQDRLLAAICAAPDDDAPRLAYADWLQASGDPDQAEFIRAQIAVAHAHAGRGSEPVPPELPARVKALERQHGRRFAGVIADRARDYSFKRGLVEQIRVDVVTLAQHADALLGSAPVRSLAIAPLEDEEEGAPFELIEQLAACPHLARVREIDASEGTLGDADGEGKRLAALLTSPYLTALEKLVLGSDGTAETAQAIAEAHERLPSLHTLMFEAPLGSCHVGDEGAVALAASPLCAQLEVLAIAGSGLGPRGAGALASAFHRLRELYLTATWYETNPIGPEGARALANATGLSNLHVMDLSGAGIGDEGLEALATASWLPALRELNLGDNNVTDYGVLALARSGRAGHLRELSLGWGDTDPGLDNQVSPFTLHVLADLPQLARVRVGNPSTWHTFER